ncbi:MAG TPA: TonB-dependent receptor [Gemmatimonadales bacterium]|nr:TonB-dependent receptor [Gemmatimonadales bacterium]
MPLNRAVVLGLLMAAPLSATGAQSAGVVYGTVADAAGRAIAGALVRVAGTRLTAVADETGHYRLTGVPAGRIEVRAARIGYETEGAFVALAAGDSVREDFVLRERAFLVQPTIVTAAKRSQFIDQAVTSVAVVSDSDIARRAVSTVDEAVNKAPGVLFLNGQVNIRGSSGFVEGLGSRVLLLVDGVPANEGDRGGIDWDMVPLDEVDKVEVVKGVGSSLYGSAAFGGVVNLITRDIPLGFHGRVRATGGGYANPPDARWRFRDYTGGLGGLDVTGSYASDALRSSLTLGGRRSDGYREQDKSDQWEAAGKAEWHPAPDTRVTASGSWTSHQYDVGPPWCEQGQCDDRGLAFQPFKTASPGAYTRSDKGYLAATLERTASARFAWQARGSWLRTHFTDVNPDNWGVGNRVGAELRGTARSGSADERVVTVGAEATRSDVVSDIFGDHAQDEFAAYAEGEQRAGRARVTAGARADLRTLDSAAVSGVVSPRVGAVLPTSLGTWRASVGRGFRAPSLAERFVSTRAFGYRVVPNPGLAPETAWSFELGNAAALGSRGRLDAAIFWTEAYRLIEPAFIKDSGAPAIQLRNVARARLRGFDAALVATPFARNLLTSISYTFLDTRDDSTGSVLAFRPRHVATLGADYAWRSLTVGGDFRFVSRIERIELAGSYAGDPRVAAKVLDLRAAWQRGAWSARLLVTNALNYIYSLTPGTLEPVRTLSVVLGWTY